MDPLSVSPCIGVCLMDPATNQCAGCYRTLDEIAGWTRMSREEKLTLLDSLRQRRRASGKERPRPTNRRRRRSDADGVC